MPLSRKSDGLSRYLLKSLGLKRGGYVCADRKFAGTRVHERAAGYRGTLHSCALLIKCNSKKLYFINQETVFS
jgi:hypothetical protein